jgi:hypothetical protein
MEYTLDGRTYKDKTFCWEQHDIFVFGSNLAGIHGAGAALHARLHHGARQGLGIGLVGTSYAIPTKNEHLETLPLTVIKSFVDRFIDYARATPELTFFVTRIGCGLAGYTDEEVRPMFHDAPDNVELPEGWRT